MQLRLIAALAATTLAFTACASRQTETNTGEVLRSDTTAAVSVRTADTIATPRRDTSPMMRRDTSSMIPRDTSYAMRRDTLMRRDTSMAMQPGGMSASWRGTIKPKMRAGADTTAMAGMSRIGGTVTVMPSGISGQTSAQITVTGAPRGTLPWHVHVGSCANPGAIIGPPSSYPPLTVASDGSATASVTVPVPTPTTGDYSVNVHQSGTIIACGDLKKGGM